MGSYDEQWSQYRKLKRDAFAALAALFICCLSITVFFDQRRQAVIWNAAGIAGLVSFAAFCYYGLRFARFKCPRCKTYFSRGKQVFARRGPGLSCRHCGLPLYGGG